MAKEMLDLPSLITEGHRRAINVKDKEIVILIGATGAGKSTLITYLMGADMEVFMDAQLGRRIARPKISNDSYPPLGHEPEPMTFYTEPYRAVDGTILCDLPGFTLKEKGLKTIAESIIKQMAINSAKSIKVIVVISYHELMAVKGAAALECLEILGKVFNNTDDILGCVQWVITQQPAEELTVENVLTSLNGPRSHLTTIRKRLEEVLSIVQQFMEDNKFVRGLRKALREDSKEAERLAKQKQILESMTPNNVTIVNILRNGDRKIILDRVKNTSPVASQNFKIEKANTIRASFERIAFDVEQHISRLFQERTNILSSISEKEKEIDSTRILIDGYMKKKDGGGDGDGGAQSIQDLENQKTALAQMIKTFEDKINRQQGERNLLDTNEEILACPPLEFSETRALPPFGWFGYSSQSFKYQGEFTRVEESFDPTKGKLIQRLSNPGEGTYQSTYVTNYGENAAITINFYIPRRDKYSVKAKINAINAQIKQDQASIGNLHNQIAMLEKNIVELKTAMDGKGIAARITTLNLQKTSLEKELAQTKQKLQDNRGTLARDKQTFMAFYQIIQTMPTNESTVDLFSGFTRCYRNYHRVEREEPNAGSSENALREHKRQAENRDVRIEPNSTSDVARQRIARNLAWLQPGMNASRPHPADQAYSTAAAACVAPTTTSRVIAPTSSI